MGFNPGGGGGIAGASDVAFSGLQDNEVLTYDSASSKWQNDVSAGGAGTATAAGAAGAAASGRCPYCRHRHRHRRRCCWTVPWRGLLAPAAS